MWSVTRSRVRLRNSRWWGVASVALLAGGLALGAQPAGAADGMTIYAESFAGADTQPGVWNAVSTGGTHDPCITAATGATKGGVPKCKAGASDAVGSGVLQLSNNHTQESGFVLTDKPLTTKLGLDIDFDMYQFNSNTAEGGDGISVLLVDGAVSPKTSGQPGAGLGYYGIAGGILGVGFDEYGNFSNGSILKTGPGRKKNSVSVRGAESTGYTYISGKDAPAPLAVDKTTARGDAKRHVSIGISKMNEMTVDVDFNDGKGPQRMVGPVNLDKIDGQPALPPTVKFGWAASTGKATAYHEVSGLRISTHTADSPDLAVKVSAVGEPTAGGNAEFAIDVNNAGKASTIDPTTVTFPAPAGTTIVSAAGDGWKCTVTDALATCTRDDALPPGGKFPPVKVVTKVPATAIGPLVATAAVSTSGLTAPATPITVPVKQPVLAGLAVNVDRVGSLTAGGTGQFKVKVTNDAAAPATAGPVTVELPMPEGVTVTKVVATGWKCTFVPGKATCTREDSLKPGESFPPVCVYVKAASTVGASVTVTATATNAGKVVQSKPLAVTVAR